MLRWALLLLLLLLAACSKGAEADLPSIGEARSLAAEWELVNEQASQGHLTRHYVDTMRQSCREQIETAAKSLTQPQSPYGAEIAALLRERDDASPTVLRAHASRLKQIEDSLESA
jgi:Tfp pilus assembly protein PilP